MTASWLTAAETARALGIGELNLQEGLREQDIRNTLFGQTLGIATGTPATSLSGLSSAAGAFQSLSAQAAQRQQAAGEAAGSGVALAAKLALKNRGGGAGTVAAPAVPILFGA